MVFSDTYKPLIDQAYKLGGRLLALLVKEAVNIFLTEREKESG